MAIVSKPFSPQQRITALERLATERFDVLVIGGGVVGCGIALDAATRGLSVALVEAQDFAAGTSSRSSKLIHGGLRYLEQLDFSLVREALQERTLILTELAPHLAQPVPLVFPLKHRVWERPYVGAGVALYDLMGGRRGVPTHTHLTRRAALRLMPGLSKRALIGGIHFYDGQVDDARHTLMIARTAAQHGATCVTRARATSLLRDGERVIGAIINDTQTGQEIRVEAKHVINATGVWTKEIAKTFGLSSSLSVRTSKGVHILVPRDRIDAQSGIIARTEKSVLFVIPWDNHWLIGTTDTEWELNLEQPIATSTDIDYILNHVNQLVTNKLTRADIVGVFAGLRPLISGSASSTTKLSREHAVISPAPGFTVIAGGKYTTYRVMAKDALDTALASDRGMKPRSISSRVRILGADGFQELWDSRGSLAAEHNLTTAQMEHLLRRFGTVVLEVLATIQANPQLREPLSGAPMYLKAEITYAFTHEGAVHLEDVLMRRTRISIDTSDRGVIAAREVAELMSAALQWNDAERETEIARYIETIAAERRAQQQLTDEAALLA